MSRDPSPPTHEEWKRLPLAMRLSDEEISLVRWIGMRMSRLLMGRYEELPFFERTDELGIVANMVARVVGELRRARSRDEAQTRELNAQVDALEEAREKQQQMLQTIRILSSPVLLVAKGVLLVPMAGALDPAMLREAEMRILAHIVQTRAGQVILDVTGVNAIEPEMAVGLVGIGRSVSLLGAQVILCGLSPQAAALAAQEDLSFAPARVCANLAKAIELSLSKTY